jgi:hypothetical protein
VPHPSHTPRLAVIPQTTPMRCGHLAAGPTLYRNPSRAPQGAEWPNLEKIRDPDDQHQGRGEQQPKAVPGSSSRRTGCAIPPNVRSIRRGGEEALGIAAHAVAAAEAVEALLKVRLRCYGPGYWSLVSDSPRWASMFNTAVFGRAWVPWATTFASRYGPHWDVRQGRVTEMGKLHHWIPTG